MSWLTVYGRKGSISILTLRNWHVVSVVGDNLHSWVAIFLVETDHRPDGDHILQFTANNNSTD